MNKIIGITNDVTQCECCGRNDLRATVVIANEDGAIIGYFGCSCARAYVTGTSVGIEKRARRVQRERNEMQADIDRQVASIMAIDRDLINATILDRVKRSGWEKLGLDKPMTPEQRREIYVAWKSAQINIIGA